MLEDAANSHDELNQRIRRFDAVGTSAWHERHRAALGRYSLGVANRVGFIEATGLAAYSGGFGSVSSLRSARTPGGALTHERLGPHRRLPRVYILFARAPPRAAIVGERDPCAIVASA